MKWGPGVPTSLSAFVTALAPRAAPCRLQPTLVVLQHWLHARGPRRSGPHPLADSITRRHSPGRDGPLSQPPPALPYGLSLKDETEVGPGGPTSLSAFVTALAPRWRRLLACSCTASRQHRPFARGPRRSLLARPRPSRCPTRSLSAGTPLSGPCRLKRIRRRQKKLKTLKMTSGLAAVSVWGPLPVLGPHGACWRGARQRCKSEATAAMLNDLGAYHVTCSGRSRIVKSEEQKKSLTRGSVRRALSLFPSGARRAPRYGPDGLGIRLLTLAPRATLPAMLGRSAHVGPRPHHRGTCSMCFPTALDALPLLPNAPFLAAACGHLRVSYEALLCSAAPAPRHSLGDYSWRGSSLSRSCSTFSGWRCSSSWSRGGSSGTRSRRRSSCSRFQSPWPTRLLASELLQPSRLRCGTSWSWGCSPAAARGGAHPGRVPAPVAGALIIFSELFFLPAGGASILHTTSMTGAGHPGWRCSPAMAGDAVHPGFGAAASSRSQRRSSWARSGSRGWRCYCG